jgi:hypothetical protein
MVIEPLTPGDLRARSFLLMGTNGNKTTEPSSTTADVELENDIQRLRTAIGVTIAHAVDYAIHERDKDIVNAVQHDGGEDGGADKVLPALAAVGIAVGAEVGREFWDRQGREMVADLLERRGQAIVTRYTEAGLRLLDRRLNDVRRSVTRRVEDRARDVERRARRAGQEAGRRAERAVRDVARSVGNVFKSSEASPDVEVFSAEVKAVFDTAMSDSINEGTKAFANVQAGVGV